MALPAAQLRRDARVERRRRRIVEAALALFAGQGYTVTSVDDIVTRARVSKSAFYEFFESKEDCFRDLLEQEGGALIHDVLTDAATGHDHHERLRLGITRFVLSCFERSDVARLLIVESVGLGRRGGGERRRRVFPDPPGRRRGLAGGEPVPDLCPLVRPARARRPLNRPGLQLERSFGTM
ncbi:MAG: helix-turn-helix transcriptional regulator [Chloroflexi bacterium]|nr:MAG: helix-turn-helix transcriptional regulator [Chloroflexota bacterium]